uniref:Uncharacterized protein n=1 Tax=Picea sitchensis TaxID=3332 RepID=D5A8K9_PICSI|nr:unknown [Picea sitchensis]
MDDTNANLTVNQVEGRWHVPFLFGGVTTLLVLVAFVLLILACSY